MRTIILLQILLIIISLAIVLSKNNLRIVIFFSIFSLVSASLYYFYKSPDLALAEAAIGSAIIPLIFIIAISKQKEFLVVSHLDEDDNFLDIEPVKGKGYKLLDEFTDYYKLKLTIGNSSYDELHGIFRVKNVDLVVKKSQNDEYIIEGKETSILMNKLEQMAENYEDINIFKIAEGEMDD